MNAEILCVGTELVLGDIVNTNAQYISQKLSTLGIDVFYQSAVGDNPARLKQALAVAVKRSNLIILTGGLGPTQDDLTIKTVCDAIGVELVLNQEALDRMKAYFARLGRSFSDNNIKQAYVPRGAVVFQNEKGTAPGCAIEKGNQAIVFLPGPPSEMKAMLDGAVTKYLEKFADGITVSKFVKIYGIGESKVDSIAADLEQSVNPTVAPYAKDGETELRVTAKAENRRVAEALCGKMIKEIENRFGDMVYGVDVESLQSVTVELLKKRRLTLATAESCTAGYISKRITDISGSSEVFLMGAVTYSPESKNQMLGVPMQHFEDYGAVSREVAASMAKGVRLKSGADIGLSITGIAGPESDGSSAPVGLSYIAISDKDGEYVIESMKGGKNDREYIRYTSASEAINFLRLYLLSYPAKPNFAEIFSAKVEGVDAVSAALTDTAETEENTADITDTEENAVETAGADEATEDNSTADYSDELFEFINNAVEDEAAAESEEEIKAEYVFDEPSADSGSAEAEPAADNAPAQPEESSDEKKPNAFVRFLKRLFPWKGDSKKEVLRKIVFIVALITLVVTLWQIVAYCLEPFFHNKDVGELQDAYHQEASTRYSSPDINPKFLELYEKNHDLAGWITLKDTAIDYPVLLADDNDKYYRADFDGKYSRYGSIYMDYRCSIKYGEESRNMVLYGHNMKDNGKSMFGILTEYRDIDFYKQHPTITFDTLYNDGVWKVFAVMTTNGYAAQDNGNLFDYRRREFESDEDFLTWIQECRLRSAVNTTVDVNPTDIVLTLQTCAYDFTEARVVVMARRVRDGEDEAVNTDGASANENARYPQAWYDKKKMTNPYKDAAAMFTMPTNTKPVETNAVVDQRSDKSDQKTSAASGGNSSNKPAATKKRSSGSSNSSGSNNSSGGNSGGGSSNTKATARRTNAASTTKKPSSSVSGGGTVETKKPEPTVAPTEAEDVTSAPEPTEQESDGGNESQE